jgi:nucleoside-diphosphate-sugar epimerase
MIGHQLVKLLCEEDAQVTVLDDFSRGRRENLEGLPCGVVDQDACKTPFDYAGKDAVFNMAAKVTGMHFNRHNHDEMFRHNMLLQTTPLHYAAMAGVPLFLQASTVCVYPHDMQYPVPEEEGHRGDPEPTNAGYGWAKRMGERYAQWMAEKHPIKVGITRFANCYGPSDYFDHETSHVIPALIRKTD